MSDDELYRSSAQIQHIVDHSPAVIYSWNVEGDQLTPGLVTENVSRVLGFSVNEYRNYDFWVDHLHPEDRERAISSIRETLDRGVQTIEYRTRHADGHYVWVDDRRRVVGEGHNRTIVGVLTDITDRKRVEAALAESEEQFRQLAENIGEVFWIFDVKTYHVLYVSPAYEKVSGRSRESLYASPQSWMEAIHPDDRARVLGDSVATTGHFLHDREYRILRPDGTTCWIRDRTFPVRNAAGDVYRIAGIGEDITERKLTADRLREQASLLDRAQEAIIVNDLNHQITYWSKGAERLYGWPSNEAVGAEVTALLQRDTEVFQNANETVRLRGVWSGELTNYRKDGQEVVVLARWTLLRSERGTPYAVLSINTDLTEKKNLEQQFLRAQRIESIGTLAGGIAHDLNNSLSPIIMSIDLLKMRTTDPGSLELLEIIDASAHRGADMVRQVLSFARGVEGRRVPVQVNHIVREVEKIVTDTFLKDITVRTALADEPSTITGDPTQIHQVLLNLCLNARDAMPSGGTLTISVKNIAVDPQYAGLDLDAKCGPYTLLQVEDTGPGILPHVIERIFDPFFTTKEVGNGTGLGLSTSLAIVRSHGGFIRVESEVGKGTTFKVYLPTQAQMATAQSTQIAAPGPRGNGELILVIDDEPAVRRITQQTLETFGYRVLLASDGAEAVAIYAQRQAEIAAVLSDMMMPVMDGTATVRILQRLNPAVRIIGTSGLPSTDHARLGLNHFLQKPFTAEMLLTSLQQVLAKE